MTGRVELVHGDMFDGPSDLVVIPCSTVPTITWFVAERLRNFKIPVPDRPMHLGEVLFCDLTTALQVAPTAAYAASVEGHRGSTAAAIQRIGHAVGQYARSHTNVERIASPLLGTGAGQLQMDAAVHALTDGFLDKAPTNCLLRLFTLQGVVYEALKAMFVDGREDTIGGFSACERPIRVFISYARSSPEHSSWVQDLATFLRTNGIDARLDLWHLRPGMDVAQWMCNELDLADRVLLICDQLYSEKADRRHGGVGWEIRIVQGDLLQSQESNPDKYVPVIISDDIRVGTPVFLRGVFGIHWPIIHDQNNLDKQNELVRALYRAEAQAPPLGRPPSFLLQRE